MSVAPNPLRITTISADAPIPPEAIEEIASLLLTIIEDQEDHSPPTHEPKDG